jgi:ABC-type Mn2+/Zn2+ transport system ATPase subunit
MVQTLTDTRMINPESLVVEETAPPGIQPNRPAIFEVKNLSAGYSDDLALENVSFSVYQGERIALVGPNGAGKSTLFKTIVGLIKPNQGQILIHGQASKQALRRVAYVPQFEEVDWEFPVSVWDVVMMGRVRHIGWFRFPLPGDIHHRAVKNALNRVGLTKFATRQISELSGGQKRRVFIARALAQEADVLLLDEPFAGVDVKAQEQLLAVLDSLQSDGVTIILATHDLTLAATHFDRVVLLHKSLVAYGTPQEVFKPAMLAQAYGGQLAVWQGDNQIFIVADQHQ